MQEGYTLAVRPLQGLGPLSIVSYTSAVYSTPGGRAFFDYLVTPEGFELQDPDTQDHAAARASALMYVSARCLHQS